jgi:hypothetical protein
LNTELKVDLICFLSLASFPRQLWHFALKSLIMISLSQFRPSNLRQVEIPDDTPTIRPSAHVFHTFLFPQSNVISRIFFFFSFPFRVLLFCMSFHPFHGWKQTLDFTRMVLPFSLSFFLSLFLLAGKLSDKRTPNPQMLQLQLGKCEL